MNYISFSFLFFVIISVIIYYLVPSKRRGIVLLIASLIFYISFDLKYLIFLLFVALSTFITARFLSINKNKKLLFVLCIILNVIVWFVVKMQPFTNLSNTIFILVPVGISYYILQSIGYLVDVYKGKIKAEKSFWKYLLFLSYFPAIVQGPISRYTELMPQLLNENKLKFNEFRDSLILILFGLVKKIVIADRLGIFVNSCFDNVSNLSGVILYIGAVFYSIQLYNDFSGCVDICRGVSKLFCINLNHNFNRPYLSESIKDFWSRWHMSLSSWLKDYIYIPLGGSREGKIIKYINIMITFIISGIWHGAGFNFLYWGILHAIYQIFGDLTLNLRNKFKKLIGIELGSKSDKIYKVIITFNLVTFAWIFFRADSFIIAIEYINNMFSNASLWTLFDKSLFSYGISQNYFNILLIHVFISLLIELYFSKQEKVVNEIVNFHLIIRWIIYLILIFDILLFGVYGSGYSLSSFMYGGF